MQHSWVFAVAGSRLHAEQIVERLRLFHLPRSDASVLLPKPQSARRAQDDPLTATRDIALSGALGWIDGLAVVTLADGAGWVAGGPLLASLQNADTVMHKVFQELGVPTPDAHQLERSLREGNALVAARSDDSARLNAVCSLLKQSGASAVTLAEKRAASPESGTAAVAGFPRFA